ncbi:MAG: RagB/SusD family nutrient uptake outer membrane protein, partial [Prevotella sp.]
FFNTRGHAAGNFNDYALTAENSTVESFYSNTYKSINYANGVLYYASANSKEAAEARFIRAYGYYLLTQQFGAVPYITDYINSARQDYPRTDLAEIYKSVIEDLADLYSNSPLDAVSHDGHASKQAVAALIAKLYLACGWDINTTLNDAVQGTYTVNSTENFTQAAAWDEKAINGVSLTMPFATKWSPYNEGNAEEIWSIQYDRASYPGNVAEGGHSLQNSYGGYFGNVMEFGLKYTGSDNQPTAKGICLFEKGDQRYEATFMTTYYNSSKNGTEAAAWGTDGYYAYYNCTADQLKNKPIALRYYPYYTTQEEVEADLAAHKSQYANYDNRAKVQQAVRLDDGNNVLKYTFNDDGSIKKVETTSYSLYMETTDAFGSVKKFDDPESAQLTDKNDYRDVVIFHVSDMYLVAAEAYLMAGQTSEALAKLNNVRNRAGLASLSSFSAYLPAYTTSATFSIRDIDLILDERARELYAERQRWMDLRRTKQLIRYNVEFNTYITSASQMANTNGEYKWLRPIPQAEISSNTGITNEDQNPGY